MLRNARPVTVAVIGCATVVVVAVIAVGIGTVAISPIETVRVLVDRLLPVSLDTSTVADPIVWNIRLPRVLAAAGAGAALGLAGTVLQGTYRNPFADPQLVGLSSVGAIGVLMGGWLGWTTWGPIAGVIGGVVAGAIGALAIRFLGGRTHGDPTNFIVVGMGFGLSVSALVAAAAIAIHDPRIPDLPFWFVGGLAGSTWGTAVWTGLVAIAALGATLVLGSRLDVMSLGWESAGHVGVDVRRVVLVGLIAAGMAVGASVGAAGVIAFIGLAAAHIARHVVGEHHRRTLVAAFFLGAGLLVTADAVGRLIGGRFEIPVGLVTAAAGGPYLVWLVSNRRTMR